MAIATINPSTGQTERTFEPLDDAAIERALEAANAAAAGQRTTPFAERAASLRAAAAILDEEVDAVARIMTVEMGKPFGQSRAEVEKCAAACRFYADHGEAFLADERADSEAVGAKNAFVRYQPLGVVLAVMPWNFPLWQALRFAAPALMAGNVGLLKHASNVPQTALYLGELFSRAGFAEGAFQAILIGSDKVEGVLRDQRVAAATLTGSTPAGRAVAAVAGDVLKPTVLELGGSDPFIVMPSADLARAAEVGVKSRVQNNGQSCISAKRFLVHRNIADEYIGRFVERMAGLVVGDPLAEDTDVGPLATEQGRDDVEELLADATGKGAEVLTGGSRPDRPGWWYPPTVVTGVTAGMRMYDEEVFGPVAAFYVVDDLDEAISIANDTSFGLGSNIWTNDEREQREAIDRLVAGGVFVNGMTTSYPELPFGGVKASGYGRELSSQGIRAFCNAKTVWIA